MIENDWHFFEPHCIPQVIYLTNKNNEFHNILKIFKLETELNKIENFLKSKIKWRNKCENNKLKDELLDYVNEKLYKLDIQFYNE